MSTCFPCRVEIRKHSTEHAQHTQARARTQTHTHTFQFTDSRCQTENEEIWKSERKLVLLLPLPYNVALCSNNLFEHITIFIINYLCAQVCSRG